MPPFNRTAFIVCLVLWFVVTPTAVGSEISNLFLPSHIDTPDGQVSLVADYGSKQINGQVPVYLVNKSLTDLALNSQDGDIYLKLEYRDSEGNWVRAQPHGYSWCGNSYMTRIVQRGHYLLVDGYQAGNGVAHTVRYKLYSQDISLVSNTGIGLASHLDIKRASSDVMSLQDGTFEYVARTALSETPVENVMSFERDLRESAVSVLASGRFDPQESYQVLLRVRERNPEMKGAVNRAIRTLSMHQSSGRGVSN